jgi:antitoxin component YwqK of YwqJK toxin-antitoxin module
MLKKKVYANGQPVYLLEKDRLTYFFKNGTKKAEGVFINDQMQGEWKFYRETGQLWQTGHFKNHKKNGSWIRYNTDGQIEYQALFENDKQVKK